MKKTGKSYWNMDLLKEKRCLMEEERNLCWIKGSYRKTRKMAEGKPTKNCWSRLEHARNGTRLNGSYRITRKWLKKNQRKIVEVAWNIQKQIKKNQKKKKLGREKRTNMKRARQEENKLCWQGNKSDQDKIK